MTQENKNLLLVDLSARLPYTCRVFYEYVDDLDGKTYGYSLTLNTWCINEFVANKAVVKPYLRPMSSMTEEERKEYEGFIIHREHVNAQGQEWDINCFSFDTVPSLIDWLNSHHFDYRGLIEKGLAIEAVDTYNP